MTDKLALEAIKASTLFYDVAQDTLDRADKMIFVRKINKGDSILVSGNVVYVLAEGGVECNGSIYQASGDIIGLDECIQNSHSRYKAIDDSILVGMPYNELKSILAADKDLLHRYNLIVHSKQIASSANIKLGENERIELICRRDFIIRIKKTLLPLMVVLSSLTATVYAWAVSKSQFCGSVSLVALLIGALWLAWGNNDWKNDYLVFTDERVMLIEKVLGVYEKRIAIPMQSIRSASVNTSFIKKIMHMGDITTKSVVTEINFHGFPHPFDVMSILHVLMKKYSHKKPKPNGKSDKIFKRMPLIPKMRMKYGDTIVYHTHWIVLIEKSFWVWMGFLFYNVIAAVIIIKNTLVPPAIIYAISGIIDVILVARIAFLYADWNNDYYIINPQKVIDVYKKPFSSIKRDSASLTSIMSTSYNQKGILGILLNYGTVHISVGDDKEIIFDRVKTPSQVVNEINAYVYLEQLKENQKGK